MTEQSGDVRFEWGEIGAGKMAVSSRVLILVDIFSFSTALDVAVSRNVRVYPFSYNDRAAAEFARTHGAALAVDRRKLTQASPYSLWPASLATLPFDTRLVLPSLYSAALTTIAAHQGGHVFAGCLRNRAAIASAALSLGSPISVIAAGERWPNEGFRVAYEDLIGAGAIIAALVAGGARPSPEAAAAAAAYEDAASTLGERLRASLSARELHALGCDEAPFASQIDVSSALPYFKGGVYQNRAAQNRSS